MYRFVEEDLKLWKKKKKPLPILLRGARQVGKSFTVRKFAKNNFDNFCEINFERDEKAKLYFENLDVKNIILKLSSFTNTKISKGKTLLFLDEIQQCPKAILALRYFYEDMPGLHVIGAGSLVDFALKSGEYAVPVGRVQYFFMAPMSFSEFLLAANKKAYLDYINNLSFEQKDDSVMHERLLEEFRMYMLLGGMPAVLEDYFTNQDLLEAFNRQSSILLSYKDDFSKYSKHHQYKYLQSVLLKTPRLIGSKLKYSQIDSDYKSADIKEALILLSRANLIHLVPRTSGAGLPLGAEASDKHFKAIFLDIGLIQKLLSLNNEIINASDFHSIATGALTEQFVGQELLSYINPYDEKKLYFWEREDKSNAAEIDYLHVCDGKIYPIEVKAAKAGRLKSLRIFMETFKSPFGLRISQRELSFEDGILSVPLYAVSNLDRLIREATRR